MAPDPGVLGSDIVLGPLGLLAFIATALGYAAREYRKGREQRVEQLTSQRDQEREEHFAEKQRLEQDRDEARADANEANDQLRENQETNMRNSNVMFARLVRAREMLVERGVKPEDLP